MREIKFRAWVEAIGDMYDWEDLAARYGWWEDDDYVLMQYTGLKDKNGKEIYEGDVVQFSDRWEWYRLEWWLRFRLAESKEEHRKLKAEYDALPLHTEEIWIDDYINGGGRSKSDLETYCEVIGNIYENPELLTKDK